MPATSCVNHPDRDAVGNCGHCHRFFCGACLGLDARMQPICSQCEKEPAPAAAPNPAAAPLPGPGGLEGLRHKVVDDDPLGLLGTPAPAAPAPKAPPAEEDGLKTDEDMPEPHKPAAPAAAPAPPPVPAAAPRVPPGGLLDDLLAAPKPSSPVPPSKPTPPPGILDDLLGAAPVPLAAAKPAAPPPAPAAAPTAPPAPGNLDDIFSTPIAKPKLPMVSPMAPAKAPLPVAPLPKLDPVPVKAPMGESARTVTLPEEDLAPRPKKRGLAARMLGAHWKIAGFKVPAFALATGLVVLVGVGGFLAASSLGGPGLRVVGSVTPLHLVQVDASQIPDMDVTSYSDIQSRLQALQFTSFTGMTIPELPSPNFFNVQMKPAAGTYAEIIKMPGKLNPVLSYVTVFNNGVWYSTNGWNGKNQDLEYLVSRFLPNDDPDQLYVAHLQGLDKLKSTKGWTPQPMSQDRYMTALTDHVRWYLDLKGLAAYQAQFADWH